MLEKLVLFVRPLGVELWIQDDTYQQRVQWLTGFAACICLDRYGGGKQVAIGTVYGALSTVGKMVVLAYEGNPIKAQGDKYLSPRMKQTMEGWRKEDPRTKNKLPVGIDVPDVLAELGMAKDSTEVVKAVGDYVLITLFYLLRVGE